MVFKEICLLLEKWSILVSEGAPKITSKKVPKMVQKGVQKGYQKVIIFRGPKTAFRSRHPSKMA